MEGRNRFNHPVTHRVCYSSQGFCLWPDPDLPVVSGEISTKQTIKFSTEVVITGQVVCIVGVLLRAVSKQIGKNTYKRLTCVYYTDPSAETSEHHLCVVLS